MGVAYFPERSVYETAVLRENIVDDLLRWCFCIL